MTESRELTSYCQDSVRPIKGRSFKQLIDNIDDKKFRDILVKSINDFFFDKNDYDEFGISNQLPSKVAINGSLNRTPVSL